MGKRWRIILACSVISALPLSSHAGMNEGLAAVADQKFYRVTVKDAQAAVAESLAEKGAGDKVSALVIGKPEGALYAHDSAIEIEVKTLSFDEKTKTWEANLLFRSEGEVLSATPAKGRYELLFDVPVLLERAKSGQTITAEMIEWVEMPESRIRQQMVMDEKQLIGKSPRRVISAKRPIRLDELQQPSVLNKGDRVTMLYSQGTMEIKTTGEALEKGAEGDTIRVRNLDSKKTVYAVVESADTVRVTGNMQQNDYNRKAGKHD